MLIGGLSTFIGGMSAAHHKYRLMKYRKPHFQKLAKYIFGPVFVVRFKKLRILNSFTFSFVNF